MKKTLYLIVGLFTLVAVIVILGNIITIGEKMTAVIGVTYLEYAFYLILFGAFIYLSYIVIIQPLMIICNAPEFPILSIEEKEKGFSDDEYRLKLLAFGKELCNNCYYLPITKRETHQKELKTELAAASDINQIKSCLSKELKQRYSTVDRHIINYASKVFIITAISSSSRIDVFATLGLNYRMVAAVVRASGFRPNKIQLVKIYYYVISSAFLSYFYQDISESVDDMLSDISDASDIDVSDVEIPDFDASNVDISQYVRDLRIPGIPLAPLADGLANAIMTIAIGYITKFYLQKGSKELKGAKGRSVKLEAKLKAFGQVPRLLKEVPQQIGNSGLSWFMKGFEKAYSKMEKKSKGQHPDSPSDDLDIDDNTTEPDNTQKSGISGYWKDFVGLFR